VKYRRWKLRPPDAEVAVNVTEADKGLIRSAFRAFKVTTSFFLKHMRHVARKQDELSSGLLL